ncbi:MAG: peptidase M23 [Paracoccaceae bacterium]
MRALRVMAVVWLGLAAPMALAQSDPATMAIDAAAQLNAAHAALEAATSARDRVDALTRTIAAYETGLEAMREGLRQTALREAAITQRFETERARLGQLLGVLLALPEPPSPQAMIHPQGALGTARSGMLLADVTPAFEAEVTALRAQLDEITTLRVLQQSAADLLAEGLAGVQRARSDLSQAIANRTDLPVRLLATPGQLERLVESSDTLSQFASGLSFIGEASGLEPLPELSDAMGRWPLPVEGTILRRAGEADAAGITRPGWVVAARPLSLVTNPWPATIRYIGPLLDYGNVIVLEPGSNVLLVLAGLDEVYGHLGEVLPAGTPVGLMGGRAHDRESFLANVTDGTGAAASETLYIEVRQSGSPVDPAQWFATTEE